MSLTRPTKLKGYEQVSPFQIHQQIHKQFNALKEERMQSFDCVLLFFWLNTRLHYLIIRKRIFYTIHFIIMVLLFFIKMFLSPYFFEHFRTRPMCVQDHTMIRSRTVAYNIVCKGFAGRRAACAAINAREHQPQPA